MCDHCIGPPTGVAPEKNDIEILDAGCGTGVTTQYLSHCELIILLFVNRCCNSLGVTVSDHFSFCESSLHSTYDTVFDHFFFMIRLCKARKKEQKRDFGAFALNVFSITVNPRAQHFDALDLSAEALKVANERAERADLVGSPNNAVFHHMSLYDVAKLGRTYDFVNCVSRLRVSACVVSLVLVDCE